jgi:hypothetical protein
VQNAAARLKAEPLPVQGKLGRADRDHRRPKVPTMSGHHPRRAPRR